MSNELLGNLFVIAAPSGAGKTSLVHALLKSIDAIQVSISYTTRPPRPGEQEGVDYHFVDDDTFTQMQQQQQFLEHAMVFDYAYGTAKAWVEQRLQQGIDVILEIDCQGARLIKQQFANCVSIFILPPSRQVLRQRLLSRDQDTPEVIEKRLLGAREEMTHYAEFDYLLVNDDFAVALAGLQAIVSAQRLSQPLQARKHQGLLAKLVKNE